MLSTIRHYAEKNPDMGNGDPVLAAHKIRNQIAKPDSRRDMIAARALLRMGGRWYIDPDLYVVYLQKCAERTLETEPRGGA